MTLNPQQLPDWLEAMVPVITQEDRDAALAFLQGDGDYWHSGVPEYLRGERIALGWEDDDPLVQAFAQHRRAALAKAAPLIVERMAGIAYDSLHPHPNHPESDWTEYGHANAMAAKKAANAIRREVNRDA